ncbi:carbon starvation protein A [Sporomusa sp. KB1]|jgi:carbon starvation protein|uniref:carbon starvation CstA family protein n=1 Tax=Sporomusa sp. KB1 TaxID=943346 RepID=UPI0011A5CC13|nr:carbon starvation protein A [Sporomusa sp. KB1]TWH51594.1 carbon starvation protein [Sporomusa sp. KB1]TWH52172.1 carbon starvation protein [Sporomusa sp. KB1]
MNGLYLVIISALVLTLCYRYYGAFIAAKVLALDTKRPTPAVVHEDGHDYVPTNKWVTFGHHFAAIAGAGPLVGPVLAAQFGYLPSTLWILIGACMGGAVHDMIILFASVRHDGRSIAEIAKAEIGNSAGLAAAIAVIFILVITMAGMGIAVANALFNSPWGAFTVGATIPIALFIGVYMRYLRPGHIGEASFVGVVMVIAAVFGGAWVQGSSWAPLFTLSRTQLDIILPVYGFIAAALPVWLLLAPRDYLSTYMKIGTIGALAIGIIIVNPQIHMPAITQFVSGGGPVVPGPVWPFVCITVACGAISGFHSIIATGTTPKMITNESEILPIGFGAMLAEAFISIMALIAATSLIPADYFAINSAPAVFAKLGMNVQELPILAQLVGEDIAGRPGGAVSLAVGMAHIFAQIPGLESFMSFLYHFAIMFEALFILTIIDAGTRVGRYLLQEVGGMVYKPLADAHWIPGIIFTSALISFAWGYLLFGGSIASIWPLFGLSNQLLASMALTIGTTMLLRMGKAKYLWVTLIPLCFMLVTAMTAGFYNIFEFYVPKAQWLLAGASVVMMILIVFVIVDAVKVWFSIKPAKDVEEVM